MDKLAQELNNILDETIAGSLLSALGRRLYFPKGIIAQSAEAKRLAYQSNATIGMAYHKGIPLIMPALSDALPGYQPEDIVMYAPTAGIEKTRHAWREQLLQKNPSLVPEHISLPVVVPGITAGLSYMGDLFLDNNTSLILNCPCWDNYTLIFAERHDAAMDEVPLFLKEENGGTKLDTEGLAAALKKAALTGHEKTVRLLLNFPNNPSGYSPTPAEADRLLGAIKEIADDGAAVLVLCDDAYFGLFYEENCIQESLFSRLSNVHDRVLAVKIDGPTKEDYTWGLRMGFVTFGSRSLQSVHYDALIKKLMGAIRSSVSCANTPAQVLMLSTMADPRTDAQKKQYFDLLQNRYQLVKRFVDSHPHQHLQPLPFNSGYFMSFRCVGINAERLRVDLLNRHGIGTIAFGTEYLRVAFASMDAEQIEPAYRAIYDAATTLGNQR
jgi:aspartate/methionine/tyrosine aminotransferase